jgi:hypothetical protein
MTFDQATVDGTGAFLVHELERLDQTLNLPLVNFTWSRDIQLREDVSIADEISSFTNTTFAAAGTPNANGKNWLSKALPRWLALTSTSQKLASRLLCGVWSLAGPFLNCRQLRRLVARSTRRSTTACS